MARLFVLIVLAIPAATNAAPLFDDESVVEVTLRGPVSSLLRDSSVRDELPFDLTAQGVTHNIEVRIRGNSRLRVCGFYPLRLNFDPDATAGTLFAGQDKLKLVTHCRNHDSGEQNLLEEYLAYRIFNVISDVGYRVRLLRVHYEDTDGRLARKASPRYAFVIESDRHLAERTGSTVAELIGVPKKRFDREHAARVFVFQYLIGNTDWGFVKADYDDACCHNGDLFEIDDRVYFVPYDFDLAGLVNARYAYPDPTLRIDKVTTRRYRGLCMEQDVLQTALQAIKAREEEILAVVEETAGLAEIGRMTAMKYVQRFFDLAHKEDKLLRSFARRCL